MQQLTPMMQQYVELKEKYKDCLLMYRLGDFYELFFEDALTASRELEIVLTGRDCGLEQRAPMCGVPYHAVQGYVDKLIKKGYKVAICEQLSDPALSKGLVERDVIRVITPGTVTENGSLSETDNNYILSLFAQDGRIGLAYCDVSTGAFYAAECAADEALAALMSEASRIQPSEIIYSTGDASIMKRLAPWIKEQGVFVSEYPEFAFERAVALDTVKKHFNVAGLSGFGIDENAPAACAAGALIDYLKETQKNALSHINAIRLSSQSEYMAIDMFTRSNLELTKTLREGKVRGSLFGVLDHTKTSMGARLLKRSIGEPLQDIRGIDERLDAVEEIVADPPTMDRIALALGRRVRPRAPDYAHRVRHARRAELPRHQKVAAEAPRAEKGGGRLSFGAYVAPDGRSRLHGGHLRASRVRDRRERARGHYGRRFHQARLRREDRRA